jgi:histidinol-phosphate aminotransferase
MSLSPKPEIEGISPCPHGGPDYEEMKNMGIAPEEVLDFSVNFNPLGTPVGVKEAIYNTAIDRYPDSEATELRRCLAEKMGMLPENILVGNGSVELIRLAALAYFGYGDLILLIEPTFGEDEVACCIVGCQFLKQQLKEEEGFRMKTEETIRLIHRYHPRGIFICNPNNPTGQYLTREEVEAILDASKDSLVILDEAYISFVNDAWSSLDMIGEGNMLVLRTMTKDYALAGLRLGYAIAHPQVISNLRRISPPWNVNVVAQQAGVIVLKDDKYMEKSRSILSEAKSFLITELTSLGLPPLPSQANFFLVKVGDAREFRLALLKQGILVRDCSSFGLPNYVRIAARTVPDCQRLVAAIKEIVK